MILAILELLPVIAVSMLLGWWAKSFYDECAAGAKSWQERMEAMRAEREREQAERERAA